MFTNVVYIVVIVSFIKKIVRIDCMLCDKFVKVKIKI